MSFNMNGHEYAAAVSSTNAGDSSSTSGNGVTQNAASTPLKAAKRGARGKGPLAPKPAGVEKKSTNPDRAYLKADYSGEKEQEWPLLHRLRTNPKELAGNKSIHKWWSYEKQPEGAMVQKGNRMVPKGDYKCVCGEYTVRQGDMDRHIIHQHFGKGKVNCPRCNVELVNASYARAAHMNVCGKQKPHACASCGTCFADPSAAKKCSKKCNGTPRTTTRAARTVPVMATSQEEVNSEEAFTNASFLPLESYRAPHTTVNAQQSVLAAPAFSMAVNGDELPSSGSSSPFECSGVPHAPLTTSTSLPTASTFPLEVDWEVAAFGGSSYLLEAPEGFPNPPNVANPYATLYPLNEEDNGTQDLLASQLQAVNSYGNPLTGFNGDMMVDNPLDLSSVSWRFPEPLLNEPLNNYPGAFLGTPQGLLEEEPICNPELYQFGDAAQLPYKGQLNNCDGNPVTPFRSVANDEATIDPQLLMLGMSQPGPHEGVNFPTGHSPHGDLHLPVPPQAVTVASEGYMLPTEEDNLWFDEMLKEDARLGYAEA